MGVDFQLHLGDCLEVLKVLPDNSVDSVVTDPPYGLGKEPDALAMLRDWLETGHHEVKGRGFMGKSWDAFVPQPVVWREVYRVLKPGGHLLAFAGTRTQDLMALGLRLAGFEIRDMVAWVYGSGFPKSLDVSKAIDKEAGVERTEGAREWSGGKRSNNSFGGGSGQENGTTTLIKYDTPATLEAREWQGWGTALKPALEPITLARKPLEGTVAQNVLKWHTGALNIDGCRVQHDESIRPFGSPWKSRGGILNVTDELRPQFQAHSLGRWPANLILSYPENEYELRSDITPEQLMELARWMDENKSA